MSEEETPTVGNDVAKTPGAYTGRVKWFNNRAGYGFITITSEDDKGDDLFVHHSAINVGSEQYKYLVEGEYIVFDKICSENSEHKFQAGNVTGVAGGQLMCETRNASRGTRTPSEGVRERGVGGGDQRVVRGKGSGGRGGNRGMQQQRVYARGGGPREGEEWFLVKRRAGGGRMEGGRMEGGRGRGQGQVTMGVRRDNRYPEEFAQDE